MWISYFTWVLFKVFDVDRYILKSTCCFRNLFEMYEKIQLKILTPLTGFAWLGFWKLKEEKDKIWNNL